MNATTIRAIVLALLALVNLIAPLPEEVRETIADHATAIIGGVLGLWALFAARRSKAQREGREP